MMRHLILICSLLLLAACGASAAPPEITPFPDANTVSAADAPTIAQALVGSFAMALAIEPTAPTIELLRVPDATTWSDIRTHFDAELERTGWQPVDALRTEGDTFSTLGWRTPGRIFAIGFVDGSLGEGAYLVRATVAAP